MYKSFCVYVHRDVDAAVPIMRELSKLFPQILVLFQSRIPEILVLHMLNKGKDVSLLKPSRFIATLLEKSNMKELKVEAAGLYTNKYIKFKLYPGAQIL